MNKLIVLAAVTAVLIMTVILVPAAVEKSLPSVNTARLSQVSYTDSVTALGEVFQYNQRYIQTKIPVVVSEVLITDGQTVQNGQPVLNVDKEETAKKMLLATQYQGMVQYKAENLTFDEIMAQIPDQICSEITGSISDVNVSAGDFITEETKIASIIGSTDLCVKVSVPESEISKIALGQKTIITGTAFGDREYTGVVEDISNIAAKQYTGALQDTYVNVKIRFSNADEGIRIGNSAKVKILISEEKSAEILPYEAVNSDENGNCYVYVFNSGIAVKKDVETGTELKDGIEVLDGVDSGDTVVYSDEDIKNGGYIKIKE